MKGRRNPFVAREGIPFLSLALALTALALHYGGMPWVLPSGLLVVWLYFVFRDPPRDIPAMPLGIVSPVDGNVVDVGLTDCGVLMGEAHRLLIRVDSFGTYTARSPVEGKVMDLHSDLPHQTLALDTRGLWVRTDEGDDVVLQFRGYRFGLAPLAFPGYGERVGQGQRCAYLRLTRFAELELPLACRVHVTAGQRVHAGTDVLARLPHH